ncbi:DEAD/DEAH box helicase [Caldisphaera lagunensis]|nr:DEAD/DEAH box helicase [Caldisphaera lagunensis]
MIITIATIIIIIGIISYILYYNSKKILFQNKKIPKKFLKKIYINTIEWYITTSKNYFSNYAKLILENKEDLDVIRLSKLIRRLNDCPKDSENLSLYLPKLGLYEDVIMLSSKGCSVSSESLLESRNALVALGISKWEKEASIKLGKEPILSKKADIISLYCSKDKISAYVDGLEIDIPPKGSEWRIMDPKESLELLLSSLKPSKIMYWGDCETKFDNYNAINVKNLYSIAFPDSETSIVSAYYHLMIPFSTSLAKAVYTIALLSKKIIELVNVDWKNMPDDVKYAETLPDVQLPKNEESYVIISDKPRLIYPIWKPYTIKPLPLNGNKWDYAARISMAILKERHGDITKAALIRRGIELDKSLPYLIVGNIIKNNEQLKDGYQVEPWDLDCVEKINKAKLDCIGSNEDCLFMHGLTIWEKELINIGASIPCKNSLTSNDPRGIEINDSINIKFNELFTESFIPYEISKSLNINGPTKTKVKVISYSSDIKDPVKASEAALKLLGYEGKRLIITPNNALAKNISNIIDGVYIENPNDMDYWFNGNKVGVISYEKNLFLPETSFVASNVVLVFPERMINNLNKTIKNIGNYDFYIYRTLELSSKYGSKAISRALSLHENREFIELVEPKEDVFIKNEINYNYLLDEVNSYFNKLWKSKPRPYQQLSISSFFKMLEKGNPTVEIVILPTGAGKSAIFQIISKVLQDSGFGGSAIIVSPLKALIHDQVENAKAKGFKTLYIDSSIPLSKRIDAIKSTKAGFLDFLYITPERFGTELIDDIFENGSPSLIVLDEAHTLSKWGFSFRPSYLYMATKLQKIRKNGYPPIIALTATAPKDVINDILESLGYNPNDAETHHISLKNEETLNIDYNGKPLVLIAPTIRDELKFDVIAVPDSGEERLKILAENVRNLEEWADKFNKPWLGLIFAPYVESKNAWWFNAENLSKWLSDELNEEVLFYHGKLNEHKRREIEKQLMELSKNSNGPRISVVTKAFGMGIDIPNIRWIIHSMPSESIEDFYQESGRAGRDGNEAKIITLFNPNDILRRKALAQRSSIKASELLKIYNKILAYRSFFSEKSGKVEIIPVPLDVLSKDEWASVRYLDVLRNAGVLDYSLIKGPIKAYQANKKEIEMIYGWCIPFEKDYCLTKGGLEKINNELKPIDVSTALCQVNNIKYQAFIALNKNLNISKEYCNNSFSSDYNKNLIALISLSPGEKRQTKFLDEDIFNEVLRFSKREIQKIEDMQKIIEEAIAIRSRNGQNSVDPFIKKKVEEYLTKDMEKFNYKKIKDLGNVIECTPLKDCANKIAQTIVDMENTFGKGNVTIAVNSIESLEEVEKEYRKITGITPKFSNEAYRKILTYINKGKEEKIMDFGYIVVIAKKNSRNEIMEDFLKKYKYAVSYFYKF